MNTIITGNGVNLKPYLNSIEKKANLAPGSRFFSRIGRRYGAEFERIAAENIDLYDYDGVFTFLQRQYPTDVSLRILRQLVVYRLLKEDCEGDKPLEVVMQKISELADFSLMKASKQVNLELAQQYGVPSNASGEHCGMAIIAMGKLGANELNVSSDIDLVYVFDEDGETRIDETKTQKSISNQEYYLKWSKGMQKQIAEVTEHGFVFRLDLALRPYGNSSASVISLQALDQYFQGTARAWERFAWLKARVIENIGSGSNDFVKKIYCVVEPFVFRPYVDFQLMESLREIHQKIQNQAEKNINTKDIKLGRGGIREIEFGVQLFQIVQGGARAELRTRSTIKAIEYLQKYKLLNQSQARYWEIAYRYLRTIEHRIQYLDDQQTHQLPLELNDRKWIAECMGYNNVEEFLNELEAISTYVQKEFDQLLGIHSINQVQLLRSEVDQSGELKAEGRIDNFFGLSTKIAEFIERTQQKNDEYIDYKKMSETVIDLSEKWLKVLRLDLEKNLNNSLNVNQIEIKFKWLQHLTKNCLKELQIGNVTSAEVHHWFEWTDSIFKRDNYLALQVEHPMIQLDIMRLMGASSWCKRYLKYYPSVIEQLVSVHEENGRFQASEFIELLNERKRTLNKNTRIEDEEEMLRLLRREHHASLFKILTADLNGELTVEEVSDDLSALAQAVLSVCVEWIWGRLKGDVHHEQLPLAIIGYGKLGSKELGYGSDLDLVLLYDENQAKSAEMMTSLARRLISWITLKTSDGDLYEIDNALRPNGSSGLLVSSFEAYEKYQRQLDLNSAWTWEHQALTRARFCIGSESLRSKFEKVRQEVLAKERDENQLKADVYEMRHKLWSAHKNKGGIINGKFSPGGMVDVEFVVQYLILSKSHEHIELTQNIGNIALLKMAEDKGLIPKGMGVDTANAYRALRKKHHEASLHEKNFILEREDLKEIEVVKKLWVQFFKPYW